MLILNFLLIAILLIVSYQDFKQRAISWWLIPLLGILFVVNGLLYVSINKLFIYFLLNTSFLLFQIIILSVYFSVKNKKLVNIINTYIGVGDILFLFVLCAFFAPYYFILFHVLGLFLVLLVYITLILFKKDTSKLIPLAGSLALVLVLLIIADLLIPGFNFYNQQIFELFIMSSYGLS
jgi:hypothetical protein